VVRFDNSLGIVDLNLFNSSYKTPRLGKAPRVVGKGISQAFRDTSQDVKLSLKELAIFPKDANASSFSAAAHHLIMYWRPN
jgi:hypothetical protein